MSPTQTISEPAPALTTPKDSPATHDIPLQTLDTEGRRLGSSTPPVDSEPGSPTGSRVFRVQETWKSPRRNVWKLASIYFAFINFGMNDASYGALLPSLQPYYHINYTIVSLVFLAPFAGYTAAAFCLNPLHERFGRRGIAIFGPLFRLISYVVLAIHPPYPAVVAILVMTGFGNGLVEGWNAWVGNLAKANELLGFMHGFYGLGATISPLIISAMVNTYHLPWYSFFYIMIGLIAAEEVFSVAAFWNDTGSVFREANRKAAAENGGEEKGGARAAMKSRVTWICSAFLLAYVGTEVSLGGWVIEFMIQVRHGQPFPSGLTATGFWLGITVGRMVLGFVTARVGEKIAVATYLVFALGMQLLFWLVPQFIVSAVAIGLLGFFLGPLFPASIVACTKVSDSYELHVQAVASSASSMHTHSLHSYPDIARETACISYWNISCDRWQWSRGVAFRGRSDSSEGKHDSLYAQLLFVHAFVGMTRSRTPKAALLFNTSSWGFASSQSSHDSSFTLSRSPCIA